mgnify:CR=1 FL=1
MNAAWPANYADLLDVLEPPPAGPDLTDRIVAAAVHTPQTSIAPGARRAPVDRRRRQGRLRLLIIGAAAGLGLAGAVGTAAALGGADFRLPDLASAIRQVLTAPRPVRSPVREPSAREPREAQPEADLPISTPSDAAPPDPRPIVVDPAPATPPRELAARRLEMQPAAPGLPAGRRLEPPPGSVMGGPLGPFTASPDARGPARNAAGAGRGEAFRVERPVIGPRMEVPQAATELASGPAASSPTGLTPPAEGGLGRAGRLADQPLEPPASSAPTDPTRTERPRPGRETAERTDPARDQQLRRQQQQQQLRDRARRPRRN